MKKLLFPLLLLLAHTGFCQIDSAKQGTFVISKTRLLIAGRTTGDMVASIKQLVDDPTLRLLSSCAECRVVSFEIVACSAGVMCMMDANGNKFTPEMINFIQKLQPGLNLIVQNVRITNPDGTKSIIPGKNIRII